MHNKIKALLATVLLVVGGTAFVAACAWYPRFMLNALAIGFASWATYTLYTGLVTYFDSRDKHNNG